MGKGELAEELFLKGYNCAQAVAGAFAEDIGMDFDTAVKTVSSFGGGMGRLREVCGAVSGMFFVAGDKRGRCTGIVIPKIMPQKKSTMNESGIWQKNLKNRQEALSAANCLGRREKMPAGLL